MQRASKEKRFQMEQGRAFGEILANHAAMEMQRAADADPPYFMPTRGSKHKPGKKSKTVEDRLLGRKSAPPPTLNALLDKLNTVRKGGITTSTGEEDISQQDDQSGEVVLGRGPEPRPVRPIKSTDSFPNPPLITQAFLTISVCHGCPRAINSQDISPPNDLLFKLRAVRPYMDPRTRIWVDRVANVYFHLSMTCLQKFDPTLKLEDLTMTNEMFCPLSEVHVQHLRQKGFLQHVIHNIENRIQVSANHYLSKLQAFVRESDAFLSRIACDVSQ